MENDDEKDKKKGGDNISIDELYCEIGEFGLWQWAGIALLWLPSLASGMMVLTFSYSGKIFSGARKRLTMCNKRKLLHCEIVSHSMHAICHKTFTPYTTLSPRTMPEILLLLYME